MSEKELVGLSKGGGRLKEEVEKMGGVKLELCDGRMYWEEGKIDGVSGVMEESSGCVSMGGILGKKENMVGSGGMGKVVLG